MSIARRTRRPVSGNRFARTLRRLRWPLMIAWLIAIIFLFPLASSLSHVTNNTNAANLPASAPSTRVIALELQQPPGTARASLRPIPRSWCSPAARA